MVLSTNKPTVWFSMATTATTSTRCLRVGILKCDSFIDSIREKFGDIDHQFQLLFQKNSLVARGVVQLQTFEVKQGHFPSLHEERCLDGFVITGSRHSVNEEEEWIRELKKRIQRYDETKRKMIGICFGHQAIISALGGKVELNPKGWQVSHARWDINKDLHSTHEGLKKKSDGCINLLCMNKEIVTSLPSDFTILGQNSLCPIQGTIKHNHILTFQGHPEFTPPVVEAILRWRRGTVIDEQTADEGLSKLKESIDQEWLADFLISFFVEQQQQQQQST